MQLNSLSTTHSLPHCSNEKGNHLVLQHPPAAKLATATHGTGQRAFVFLASINMKKLKLDAWDFPLVFKKYASPIYFPIVRKGYTLQHASFFLFQKRKHPLNKP